MRARLPCCGERGQARRRLGRDLMWLILSSTMGFILATVALTATRLVINYILMPLWWWAIYDPHTQYATLNLGIYTVTSTGWALVSTALGLALVMPAALVNRVAATSHARLAARLLGRVRGWRGAPPCTGVRWRRCSLSRPSVRRS